MSGPRCAVCGMPLWNIDAACPRCLPNFYGGQKVREPEYPEPCRGCDTKDAEIASLKTELAEANRKAERNFDCHAGPECDSCDACVTCLLRENDFLENKILTPGEYIIERGNTVVFDKDHWEVHKKGEVTDLRTRLAAANNELAEAKSALHDVCLECKDWEYNYGRLCKSYAKITGELAECRRKVERAIEWRNENIINYCPECSLEIDIIDWDALEQILTEESR